MKTINFIKSIVEKKVDEDVHKVFSRYSIGEFVKEPFLIKKQKQKVVVQTGFEYLHFLHRFLSENNNKEITIEGTIESVRDPSATLKKYNLSFETKRRFGKSGDKFVLLKQQLSAEGYRSLIEELFNEFLLINVILESGLLKVKSQTTPKLGSPTEKFVKMELSGPLFDLFKKEFLFDVKDEFKDAVIEHTYQIDDLDVDEDLLMKSPNEARLKAIRNGTILRKVTLDGKVIKDDKIKLEA